MFLGADKYVLDFMHRIVFHKKITEENKKIARVCTE